MRLLIILLLLAFNTIGQSNPIIDTLLITKSGYGRISEKFNHDFDSSVFEMQNGIKNGKLTSYKKDYETNKIYIENEGFYLNGKMNGLFIYYYSNGKIESIREFKDGKLNGYLIYYYENGQIKSRTKSLTGSRFGNYNSWDEQGLLTEESLYENGELVGRYTSYYSNGNIDSTGNFIQLKGEYKVYIENPYTGEFITENRISNHIPNQDGIWKYFDVKGNLIYTKYFDKGDLVKTEKFD